MFHMSAICFSSLVKPSILHLIEMSPIKIPIGSIIIYIPNIVNFVAYDKIIFIHINCRQRKEGIILEDPLPKNLYQFFIINISIREYLYFPMLC